MLSGVQKEKSLKSGGHPPEVHVKRTPISERPFCLAAVLTRTADGHLSRADTLHPQIVRAFLRAADSAGLLSHRPYGRFFRSGFSRPASGALLCLKDIAGTGSALTLWEHHHALSGGGTWIIGTRLRGTALPASQVPFRVRREPFRPEAFCHVGLTVLPAWGFVRPASV